MSVVHSHLFPPGQPYSMINSQVSTAFVFRIVPVNRNVTHLRNSGSALYLIYRTWALNQPKGSGIRDITQMQCLPPPAYVESIVVSARK